MSTEGCFGEGFPSRAIHKELAVSLEGLQGGRVEASEALFRLKKQVEDVPDFEEKGLLNGPRLNSGF